MYTSARLMLEIGIIIYPQFQVLGRAICSAFDDWSCRFRYRVWRSRTHASGFSQRFLANPRKWFGAPVEFDNGRL